MKSKYPLEHCEVDGFLLKGDPDKQFHQCLMEAIMLAFISGAHVELNYRKIVIQIPPSMVEKLRKELLLKKKEE